MEEHGRHLKSLEVRRAAGGARDSSGAQPKSSLGTAAAVTHDRTVARRFHRTHKEGYRGSNYLWSGCFFNLVGSLCRSEGSDRFLPQHCGRDQRGAGVLPAAAGGAGGDGSNGWIREKSSADAVGGRSGSGGAESARGTGVCEVTGAAGEDRSYRCPSDRRVCGSKKV